MKKIFTLAAAVLASFSLWAETIVLSEVTPEENWDEVAGVGRISNKSGSAFSDPDMSCEGITGFKTGSSYFTIQTYAALNGIDWFILGPIAMTALFLGISIPLMEHRQLANKPVYAEYKKQTRILI
jgi:hypothetical protein